VHFHTPALESDITQEANRASCRLAEKLGMRKVDRRWEWEAWQNVYEITLKEWSIEKT
jgi:RimJ/RimL family protein N-acetyltransferase